MFSEYACPVNFQTFLKQWFIGHVFRICLPGDQLMPKIQRRELLLFILMLLGFAWPKFGPFPYYQGVPSSP